MGLSQKIIQKNRDYYKQRLQIILSYVNLRKASILDLGCGEMILKELLPDNISSYKGIDQIQFSDSCDFIQRDLLKESVSKNEKADFVFLLGVLDHLENKDKQKLLKIWQNAFNKTIVISQNNSNSLLNAFYKSNEQLIDIEKEFEGFHIKKLSLIKFPFLTVVFDVTYKQDILKKLSSEFIYIISKVP